MENAVSLTPIDGIYIILLCTLVGISIIKNVPAVLHTPLMSGSNAISVIIILGGTIQLMQQGLGFNLMTVISAIGVLIGSINVAGGFFVTHRMLKMFKPKNK